MMKILRASNSAEAHVVAEALRQQGISASVRGEWDPFEGPSVWIEDDADAERANTLIASITARRESAPAPVQDALEPRPIERRSVMTRPVHAPRRPSGFVGGILLGVLIGGVATAVVVRNSSKGPGPDATESGDSNGDGVPDYWARYDANGKLVELSWDNDHDRKPDYWQTCDSRGVAKAARSDFDRDGHEDYWEYYEEGRPASYTSDNDRNGTVDEWGRLENGLAVERNWSFSNDSVADRRAFFRAGRKIREEYDRNRDGVFDEAFTFDEFERVTSRR